MKSILPLVVALIVTLQVLSCVDKIPSKTSGRIADGHPSPHLLRLSTVATPEDHMKIADYYEEQAKEMKKMASRHASMAHLYNRKGIAFRGFARHCSNLSEKYKEAAVEYKAMAIEHRNMAKEIEKNNE